MIQILRAAMVIARRDYVATVWSRSFILFLIGPLFPILFGVLFGSIGAQIKKTPAPPAVAVVIDLAHASQLEASRARLAAALGYNAVPILRVVSPDGTPEQQASHLLRQSGIVAVATGLPDKPILHGTSEAIAGHRRIFGLLVDDMRRAAALGAVGRMPPVVAIAEAVVHQPARADPHDRVNLARGAQLLLIILTMILAGMLLSNMMEEKSSKVMEVLAAAVPVNAIFFGKLVAMLGMSLTGIGVWALAAVSAISAFAPELAESIATPAVGWPAFVVLGITYFMASYLLIGALFLGIGAQAATVREVQTLSMPLTMGQLIVFALASAAVENPSSLPSTIAMIIPWSSPFAMIARAAQMPELWPHLLAILWQGTAVAFIVAVGARLFRRSVLKSGGTRWWRKPRRAAQR